MNKTLSGSSAFRFVLILGIANLFADMTYEGARSSSGQFLGTLGASAAVVGFTAGFGELLGYVLRSVSGFLADKTGKYWGTALLGYTINVLSVPALALARSARQGLLTLRDDRGRLVASARSDAAPLATLTGTVKVRHDATVYARAGDWFAWLCVLATAVMAGWLVKEGVWKATG